MKKYSLAREFSSKLPCKKQRVVLARREFLTLLGTSIVVASCAPSRRNSLGPIPQPRALGPARNLAAISSPNVSLGSDVITVQAQTKAAFLAAWRLAYAAAQANGRSELYIPPGEYDLSDSPSFTIKDGGAMPDNDFCYPFCSGMRVFGAGVQTHIMNYTLTPDSAAPGTGPSTLFGNERKHPISGDDIYSRDIEFRDLRITSGHGWNATTQTFDQNGNYGQNIYGCDSPAAFTGVDGLLIENVTLEHARRISLVARNCKNLRVNRCHILYSARDAMHLFGTNSAFITNNLIEYVGDDGIAIGSDVRGYTDRGVIVTGNTIRFAYSGVKGLGLKNACIANNTTEFCFSGIALHSSDIDTTHNLDAQYGSNASQNGVIVTGNTLKNCVNHDGMIDVLGGILGYITISGGSQQSGNINNQTQNIPGRAVTGAPTITPAYLGFNDVSGIRTTTIIPPANGMVSFQNQAVADDHNITFANNVIVRDVPLTISAQTIKDHYGWWYSNSGPVATDSTFSIQNCLMGAPGIQFKGSTVNLIFDSNTFTGLGTLFTIQSDSTRDQDIAKMWNLRFSRNQVSDCRDCGFEINHSPTWGQSLHIIGNTFDMDPAAQHANRIKTSSSAGCWSSQQQTGNDYRPYVFKLGNTAPGVQTMGIQVSGNTFRNTRYILYPIAGSTIDDPGTLVRFEGNLIECQPNALGLIHTPGTYSSASYGVGQLPLAGNAFDYAIIQGNPTLPGFGTVQNSCPTTATAAPTSGIWVKGQYIENSNPTVQTETAQGVSQNYTIQGWHRLTTGSANVLWTQQKGGDWAAVRVLA